MIDELNLESVARTGSPAEPITRSLPTNSAMPHLPLTGGEDAVHLIDYLKVLYKRRWTALTVFAIVVLSVIVYTFTATPVYEARTRLLIESEEPNVVTFKEVIDEAQSKADYYQTQYNILQSRALARKTIDTLRLWTSPLLGGSTTSRDSSNESGMAGGLAWLADLFSATPARVEERGADETAGQSRVIDEFLSRLSVSPIRNSRLVDVKFESSDLAVATQVANTLASSYIQQNLEYKFSASKDAASWLQERLGEQRKQVEVAESALQRYREQNDAISFEDRQNIVVQKLSDLNAAVTKAKTERLQKEAMYRQLVAIDTDWTALDTFPAILSNQFIQQQKSELATLQRQQAQLGEKLGERHPEMIKLQSAIHTAQMKVQAEVAKVVQAVRTEYQAALGQEQGLTAALDAQKREALSMNQKAIEYTVLDRDVKSNRQIYDTLMQRAKETGVAGELRASNIRVVDPAETPRKPVKPQTLLNLFLAVLGGGIFAIGLSFFFEYMDSRIKSPDELRTHLGLPSIGLIPVLGKSWHGGDPLISNGVPPNFAEAFRTVRTNVLFSAAAEGSRSLVVTSTAPGEGKTTVASNLAIGFAMAGQRVLLIDADMRRPRAHQIFGTPQEPGLSHIIVGNGKLSECVKKTDVPNLWVLASGHIPPNPAELLASRRFKDLLRSVGEHFDAVVVDTPPVMAVTDAVMVANVASGVVFVVGAEMTSRHAAQAAVQQLTRGHAKFVGAVLNRVEVERHSYYYAHYYRRDYAAYYQSASNA
jgi:capsular exopolysaccharide synthesis family protein